MNNYERRIKEIANKISAVLSEDIELDECAKIVITAAVEAGIPLSELKEAVENF